MKLWAFQEEDISKLETQRSALVLWDMGLGKTFGGVERDARIRQEMTQEVGAKNLRTLIVAPLSTHEQWYDWLHEVHTKPPVVLFSQDRDRALYYLTKGAHGFYIVHWELLRSANSRFWATRELFPVLANTKFIHVIGDEIHRISNRNSQQSKVIKAINKNSKDPLGFNGYRTGLTGTLITNRPPGAWSILNWLRPKDWTSYWRFFNTYAEWRPQYRGTATYKEYLGPKNTEELVGKIAPFTVQRRKEDVLRDLPDRYYTTVRVDLDPKQRRAYDSMRRDMVAWIGANEETPVVASATIAKLGRLQQFTIAHANLSEDGIVSLSEPSSKLDAAIELLDELGEEPVVVFSQSKSGIKLLAARLTEAGISYSIYHGDLSKSTKRDELDKFKRGKTRVFIATGQSGGEGIDGLQRASTLIRIDRSWSHSSEDQEESRLHRAGQKQAVHVIDIVARDTIDQLKDRRIMQKASWSRTVLDGLR